MRNLINKVLARFGRSRLAPADEPKYDFILQGIDAKRALYRVTHADGAVSYLFCDRDPQRPAAYRYHYGLTQSDAFNRMMAP